MMDVAYKIFKKHNYELLRYKVSKDGKSLIPLIVLPSKNGAKKILAKQRFINNKKTDIISKKDVEKITQELNEMGIEIYWEYILGGNYEKQSNVDKNADNNISVSYI